MDDASVVGIEGKREHDEPRVPGTSAPNLKRARVHEDKEKAPFTTVDEDEEKALVTIAKVEETFSDGDRWLHIDSNSTLGDVMFPIPTAIDKAKLVEHVK